MAISPSCDKCGSELLEFGAILLGPPDGNDRVRKYHICVGCYEQIAQDLK